MEQIVIVRVTRVAVVVSEWHVAIDRTGDLDHLIPTAERMLQMLDGISLVVLAATRSIGLQGHGAVELFGRMQAELM